jgi:uncharacterized protein
MEPAVADSACLIVLDQIGETDLLQQIFSPVYIPPKVEQECETIPEWITIKSVQHTAMVRVLEAQMDSGEVQVIALSLELGSPGVILDDLKARRVAQRLKLRVCGTIGILLRAKRDGMIAEIRPRLDSLVDANFHMTPELYREALRLAGE